MTTYRVTSRRAKLEVRSYPLTDGGYAAIVDDIGGGILNSGLRHVGDTEAAAVETALKAAVTIAGHNPSIGGKPLPVNTRKIKGSP